MINVCVTIGGNTGKSNCDVRMKRPKWLIPSNYEFTDAELADSDSLKAAMKRQMLKSSTDATKVYLFPEMRVVDDNTGDPNVQALADGYEEVLNEALPKYTLQGTRGVCQQQSMVNFNGWGGGMFHIDQDKVFWYRKTALGGKGFSTGNLYTDPPRPGNSSNIATSKTRFTYGSIEEFKSNVGAVKIDFNPEDLVNLVDIILSDREDAFGSPTTSLNVFYIGGIVECQGQDIYDAYKTALNNVNNWRSYRLDTGAALALTSLGTDDSKKAWVVTMNSATFAALPSGTKFKIGFATPDVLHTHAVEGIESVDLMFQKI